MEISPSDSLGKKKKSCLSEDGSPHPLFFYPWLLCFKKVKGCVCVCVCVCVCSGRQCVWREASRKGREWKMLVIIPKSFSGWLQLCLWNAITIVSSRLCAPIKQGSWVPDGHFVTVWAWIISFPTSGTPNGLPECHRSGIPLLSWGPPPSPGFPVEQRRGSQPFPSDIWKLTHTRARGNVLEARTRWK